MKSSWHPRARARVRARQALAATLAPLAALAGLAVIGGAAAPAGAATGGSISLVAYSTPKPAYAALIAAFQATKAGQGVTFSQSFGASGSQATAVVDGLPADVVNFSLTPDMTKLVKAGIVSSSWLGPWPLSRGCSSWMNPLAPSTPRSDSSSASGSGNSTRRSP